MSNIPSAAESARLDALTSYNATILNHLTGTKLNRVLNGEIARRALSDADYRALALRVIHPDDLVGAIARAGYSLSNFGIESISLDA